MNNKLKAILIAVFCLVASLWSEIQCMDSQIDVQDSLASYLISTASDTSREKLLSDSGVYGTFAVFKVDKSWWSCGKDKRVLLASSLEKVFESPPEGMIFDTYLLRGLTQNVDVLFRVHSHELLTNQKFLVSVMGTELGSYLENVYIFNGITKAPNYLSSFPLELKEVMTHSSDPGPSKNPYVIVIPVLKDAEWWLTEEESRIEMMKDHTHATVSSLPVVKRKLYHSTGLSEYDFITYFETSKLDVFNNLVIGLKKVKENCHNEKVTPFLLGTVMSPKEILEHLIY
jgi:chlorite dismutase